MKTLLIIAAFWIGSNIALVLLLASAELWRLARQAWRVRRDPLEQLYRQRTRTPA